MLVKYNLLLGQRIILAFEIKERDLLGRIGRLETKRGLVETPILLPVINPAIQPISPTAMQREFGCKALITNAYIIKKHSAEKAVKRGVHRLLDFEGAVMTDSGAYQILVYGNVEATNSDIIQFQEQIDTDIATILDVPTGWRVSKEHAQNTVEETVKRAKELFKIKSRDDILWVGPVQGGVHLDWVAKSAKAMSKMPFQVHALGSPTQVMEQYVFDALVDMIMAAKCNLPPNRALHLFGAGHPFIFALVVALGCDLFDSAAYAIYARDDRYMTETGTTRLTKLEYFPCSCPVCSRTSPANVKESPKTERQRFLARHNLHISLNEIKKVKQAIMEGRLWDHLEMRSHGHPALLQAVKRLEKYTEYLEANSPVTKRHGIFFYSSVGLNRPEVARHEGRLLERYAPSGQAEILVLLPQTRFRPFHRSREHRRLIEEIERKLGNKRHLVHICTYAAPFGVVPMELDEVYPLSQYEVASPFDSETLNHVADHVRSYIKQSHYRKVLLFDDPEIWKGRVFSACKAICKTKRFPLKVFSPARPWSKSTINRMFNTLHKTLNEET